MVKYKNRTFFLDYLRGFMVLYVVLDHAMHIYSPHFKKYWFLQEFKGSILLDVWHMHNDAIMMPLLFFIAGIFVIPSLERRGLKSFCKEKFYRLIVPFIGGITLIVPCLTYIKYLVKQEGALSFFDYFYQIYFTKDLSAGGFWFLYYLALLIVILLFIYYCLPFIFKFFTNYAEFIIAKPYIGIGSALLILAIILGVSDLMWGAHWWIGFAKVFYIRSARFIAKAFLFFLGAGLGQTVLFNQDNSSCRLANNWIKYTILAILSGGVYIVYSLTYFYNGAYNIEILKYMYFDGSLNNILPVLKQYSAPILIRTTLLAIFMGTAIGAYLAIFKNFFNRPINILQSLGYCSFGIYIIHEPLILAIHYWFYLSSLPILLKFLCASIIPLWISWQLIGFLREKAFLKKIL